MLQNLEVLEEELEAELEEESGDPFGSKPTGSSSIFGAGAASAGGLFGGPGLGGGLGVGGLGGGLGGGMAMGGADPYDNIQIDTEQLKKSAMPVKPHEMKSESEKLKEAEARKGTKSNLKKGGDEKLRKPSVTFGNETVYDINRESDEDLYAGSGRGLKEGKGSPRGKVKDISDGRTEQEKIRDMIAEEEREKIEQIQKMSEWKPDPQPKSKFESLG